VQEGVRVTTVGWRHRIPASALKQLEMTEAATATTRGCISVWRSTIRPAPALTEAALQLAAKVSVASSSATR